MGNKLTCGFCAKSDQDASNMIQQKAEQLQLKAAILIQSIFKLYKGIFSIKDIPFLEQAQTLQNNNTLVVQKMTLFPPFVFNRIVSKVSRELRKPVKLEGNAIYSGYWYKHNTGAQ